ncbi:hypothetical protein JKP88DRAFT_351442 [Tribonema minus]|uniref:SWIM-type domain-containing protein n=1 Tax=Tribonema minus TaxID=303371 RepID=A0A835YJ61_9STRA|nr:hypothetical protein JKP88DRAFT_351442 [Tribonema minus]
MSARLVPFQAKPPSGWTEMVQDMMQTKLFLLQKQGPTRFVIKGEDSDRLYTVHIGPEARCTCGRAQHCVHALYVMIKVLRVPQDHPLSWQLSLVDSEIDTILSGWVAKQPRQAPARAAAAQFLKKGSGHTAAEAAAPRGKSGGSGSGADDGGGNESSGGGGGNESGKGGDGAVVRLEVMPGEVCPICQEGMEGAPEELTYCRRGCGNNMHVRCMRVYAEHRRSSAQDVTCCLCRADWGPLALRELKTAEKTAAAARQQQQRRRRRRPRATTCSSCRAAVPPPNAFYRCLHCSGGGGGGGAGHGGAGRTPHSLDGAAAAQWPGGEGDPLLSPLQGGGGRGRGMGGSSCARDLCERCYETMRGAANARCLSGRHVFVMAAAGGEAPVWAVPKRPPGGVAGLGAGGAGGLLALQGREITAADYDALLALDDSGAPLHEHLLAALPRDARTLDDAEARCAACAGAVCGGGGSGGSARQLPCGHTTHDACLIPLMLETVAAAADGSGWDSCCCPLDQSALFPALCLRTRTVHRNALSTDAAEPAASAAAEADKPKVKTAFGALACSDSAALGIALRRASAAVAAPDLNLRGTAIGAATPLGAAAASAANAYPARRAAQSAPDLHCAADSRGQSLGVVAQDRDGRALRRHQCRQRRRAGPDAAALPPVLLSPLRAARELASAPAAAAAAAVAPGDHFPIHGRTASGVDAASGSGHGSGHNASAGSGDEGCFGASGSFRGDGGSTRSHAARSYGCSGSGGSSGGGGCGGACGFYGAARRGRGTLLPALGWGRRRQQCLAPAAAAAAAAAAEEGAAAGASGGALPAAHASSLVPRQHVCAVPPPPLTQSDAAMGSGVLSTATPAPAFGSPVRGSAGKSGGHHHRTVARNAADRAAAGPVASLFSVDGRAVHGSRAMRLR